jgi:hypothetical protein
MKMVVEEMGVNLTRTRSCIPISGQIPSSTFNATSSFQQGGHLHDRGHLANGISCTYIRSRYVSRFRPFLTGTPELFDMSKLLRITADAKLETPARPKRPRQTEFSTSLEVSRGAVLADAGTSIPEVAIGRFFDLVLPQPPQLLSEKLDDIFQQLSSSEYDQGRWKAFPNDPSSTSNEGEVFKGLIAIAEAIERTVRNIDSTSRPAVVLSNNPDNVPESLWRNNTSRPDGYFILRNRQCPQRPHWMDIALASEYKRQDSVRALNDVILILLSYAIGG